MHSKGCITNPSWRYHPQRALYSSLRMEDEMKRYAERLRAEKGLTLLVRVGVNTGGVVVRPEPWPR